MCRENSGLHYYPSAPFHPGNLTADPYHILNLRKDIGYPGCTCAIIAIIIIIIINNNTPRAIRSVYTKPASRPAVPLKQLLSALCSLLSALCSIQKHKQHHHIQPCHVSDLTIHDSKSQGQTEERRPDMRDVPCRPEPGGRSDARLMYHSNACK